VDAEVERINVQNGRATGVTLRSGEELSARAVVSNADPRRTMLGLVDSVVLEPAYLTRMRSYRCQGRVVKVNLALSGLPLFTAARGDTRALSGFIHIGPNLDYLEQAFDASKYGNWSPRPHLDVAIPSLTDPTLAPAGAHVMSICAQFAPYRLRDTDWNAAAPAFANVVIDTLQEYAPNLKELIVERQVITPADMESNYGLTGGHIFHGELVPEQAFDLRPVPGSSSYEGPVRGLYLCGSGAWPGGCVMGAPGHNAAHEVIARLRAGRS
jgi:phytoene dehydrogenase-like protein